MRPGTFAPLIASCVLCIAAPFAAHAEAGADVEKTESDDETYSETITVTASRTAVAVEDIGSSITLIDRDEIEQRQSPLLGDLLRGVPGLAMSRSGSTGSVTQARLRGAEANQVLVLIDGVAVNDVFAGDEIPLELLTSYDMQRVEVVRGPQSGLWGADALSGVINILTSGAGQKAEPELRLETGSFGTILGAGRFAVGSPNARLDFSGSYLDTDGTNISREGEENDGSRNGTAALRFGWESPGRPIELEILGRHTDAEAQFDDPVPSGLPSDADRSSRTGLSLLAATGRWTPSRSTWRHELKASLASTDTETFDAATSTGSTALEKRAVSLQSNVQLGPARSEVGQELTVAVDHKEREFRQRGTATPFGDPNQKQRMDVSGAVLEYRVRRPGRWSLSASARHDRNSDFEDVTTYRATGLYRLPGDRTRLRAGAGSGQKPPTFIERFGFFADTFVGNPALEPEHSTEWEIGIDQRVAPGSRLQLTYFRGRLRDEINGFVFDPESGLFTARNESRVSRRQGVEAVLSSSFLGDRVHWATTYTYTDATQPSESGDQEGELRRPRHMASARVRYNPKRAPLDLLVSLVYSGSRTDDFFPPFPQPPERVRLDGYLLADLTASYPIGRRLELFGRIENVLDEQYEAVFGFATPGMGAFAGLRFHPAR